MIVTLDPTQADTQRLTVDGREISWSTREQRAGSCLIAELQQLGLTPADDLRVITGPGRFTDLRVAALVANAVAYETGVRLFARRADEHAFQPVETIVPYYGAEPRITPPRRSTVQQIETFVSRPPRVSRTRRALQVAGGVPLLIAGGLFMFTPIPLGIPLITLGLLLVSPWHGRRLVWYVLLSFRWCKAQWFRWVRGYRRVYQRRRHAFFRHLHIQKK